jgi:hypothetical protein
MLATATRSHRFEPVCGTPKRKLEIGQQRLAPQAQRCRAENLELADQRRGRVNLTRGNVGGSHIPGNRTAETHCLAGHEGFEPANVILENGHAHDPPTLTIASAGRRAGFPPAQVAKDPAS